MADVTSRLRLVVDSTGVDKAGRKLKDLRKGARDADSAAMKLRNTFAGLASVVGAAFSVRSLTQVADAYTGIQNQLRLVTGSASELAEVQKQVLAVANETGASLDATARLYANLERFAGQFLATQQDTLSLTRAINQTAVISGASVTEAGNAVRQLSQAIAGGTLRAEEFNSIVENMPRLAEAIADGLGIGLGQLRQQVNSGLVTSQTLITALQSQFGALNEEFLNSARTIGQAMQAVGNIITVELGERLQGAQQVAIKALQFIGVNFESLIPIIEGVAGAVAVLAGAFAFSAAIAGIAALLTPLGLLTVAIGTLIAFRDDIAEWAFGVRDAGAVIQAAFEVLAPKVSAAGNAVVEFARTTVDYLTGAAAAVSDFFNGFGQSVSNFIPPEALEAVKRFASAVIDVFIYLARSVAELFTDALLVPVRGIEKLYGALGNLQILPENVRRQFQQAEAYFKGFAERVDANVGGETIDAIGRAAKATIDGVKAAAGAVGDTYDEIKVRALEIASATKDVADAPGPEKARKEVEKLGAAAAKTVKQLSVLEKAQQDIADLEQIVDAARMGERQERIAREILNLRRQDANITMEQARAIAEQNAYLDEQLEIIREQRALIEAPFENLANNLRDAIINGGKSGVGGLKGIFKSFINDLKTSFVESLFNPLSQAIRNIPNGFGVPIFGPGAGIGGGGGVFGGAVSQSLIGTSIGQQAIAGSGAGLLPFLGLGGLVRNAQFGLAGLGVRSGSLLGLGGAGQALLGKAFAGGGTGFLVSQGVNALGSLFGLGSRGNTGASIGGTIGGIAGSIIPGIGTIVGSLIGSTLGKVFGSLFGGKPSDKIGQAVFNPVTGQIVGTGKKDNSQDALNNLNIAKAISEGVSDATGIIAKLIGSETAALINVAAGNRDGIRIGLQGSAGQIVNPQRFDNTEAGAQAAVEAGIKLALQNLQGGDDTLRKVAQSLAQSGKSVEDIANTLQTIADLTDLGSEPLSEWQQRIKDLNETFDDALASVKGITEAEQELTAARDKAIAKVTGDFNKQIQDDISQYLTGPADQLERLLKAQQERFEEAKKLGADLGEVERLANLELRSFFEGLNEQALQEVQSFLGLFEEASASVARQLDLSRQDLQGQRDSFAQFAQDFAQLRTDFQERFVAASPRESLDILRARATDLLGQVGEGNASAAQALPQVLNNLVENARQSFGNTKQFQTVLDFATDIARQAEEAALGVVSDTERQIAAMDESNTLLADIRDILASSQAANAFFQSYSSGGIASSDELLKLIQEGAGLTPIANDNAAALNITSLMAQTMAPIIQPLANSIDAFTQRLSDMPNLMRLQIENDDRNTDRLVERLDDIYDVLDRTELLQKKQLEALDEAA